MLKTRIAAVMLLLVISGFFNACKQPSGSQEIADFIGVYTGIIPCADCEGIDYRIQLGEDQRYVSTSIYLAKEAKPFRAEGEYAIDELGRIMLNPGMSDQQFFEPDAGGMWWLDRQGKRIDGNLAAHYRLTKGDSSSAAGHISSGSAKSSIATVANESPEGGDLYLRKWGSGAVFYALGNEPFWSLDWIRGKGWVFKTADGPEFFFPETAAIYLTDSGLIRYQIGDRGNFLRVNLYEDPCNDGMSEAPFDFRTEVLIATKGADKAKRFSGCGSFTADTRLHNIWAFDKLDGEVLKVSDYPRGGPTLELNLSTHLVYGYDGCNRFSGRISAKPGAICFEAMAGTLMACAGDLVGYRAATLLANQSFEYQFDEKGNLLLLREGRESAQLHHID